MRLGNIIEMSDVRLVVELDDAERDPDGIFNSFILTEEVEKSLRSILYQIEKGKGSGAFIKGNFGSGKSHFLSFLYLLLRDKKHPILRDFENVRTMPFNIIKLSLVRYPASLNLENILLQCLNYRGSVTDREGLFKDLLKGPSVILIDEVSEFLRSKPSAPLFYEDLRFLQFLGEFSMRHPLWIVASLQEWIEETGHISSSLFNRIKDRYPLRLNLTSSHIEDIIDQRLIKKKEGSIEVIKAIFDELKRFYPHLELSFDRFKKTYPLHPLTVRFLNGLTRVFSQHRGVIQFVQSEVRKRLDDPPDSLITPETIFDHFEDRIREIPESSPLVRVVYEYYKNNLSSIFQEQKQRAVSEDVIKILILTELSPIEKRKTAKDVAEILLKKISTITDKINYDYIKNGILEPLVSHQMYITRDGEVYFIDISQDEGLRLKARIKAVRERFHDRDYLFGEISNLLSLPYLPLRDIKEGRRYRFRWQNSLRECIVLISTGVSRDDLERFQDGIKKRVDGYLIILSPFHPFTPSPPNLFTDSAIYSSILLWQPRKPTEEETLFIEEYIAKTLIAGEFPSLKEGLKNSEALFRETITNIYFEGKVLSIDGRDAINIKDIGYLPMERLLSHLLDAPLRELYPEHHRIMPRIDIYSSQSINNLFSHFIRPGKATIEEAEKRGLVPLIKGLLEPLGLVAKRGSTYTLHISPDNEIISHILNIIDREKDIYRLRLNLKKSSWGLTDDQIDLLLSSLIVSGYLIPHGKQEEQEFKDITQLSSGDITALKQGKAIGNELLSAIPKGRFIWGDTETAPTPATIKHMWKEASQFIRRLRSLLDELQSMVKRYQGYSIFKLIKIDMPLLNRITMFVQSIRLNMSAEEGIERVLTFLSGDIDLEGEVTYIERLYKFFDEEFQLINKYYLYLTHPSMRVEGELLAKRESLLKDLRDALQGLKDLEEIRQGWTDFYDAYSSAYRDAHDRFYDSSIFTLKDQLEGLKSLKTLKRIAHILPSITFEREWWEIKRMIEELPERCRADLKQELFINPVCRCGLNFGMDPQDTDIDIPVLCEEGLKNFLRTIQSPENREKIDSTITGLRLSGKKELSQKLLQLLAINPEKTHIDSILPLIDDEALQEIENAFKGRWRLRELVIDDLTEMLRGRRFRYDELKRLLLGWLGEDTESIIHVTTRDGEEDSIMEELSIYGMEGKRAAIELADLSPHMDSDELRKVFDTINLRNFETSELMKLLKIEKKEYMKKRLRDELFERAWASGEWKEDREWQDDDTIKQVFEAITLIKGAERFKGVHVFTDIIAPLSCILERLSYGNINNKLIDHELLKRLYNAYIALHRSYEKRPDRYDGARDIEYVKDSLSGNVVVLDGLRYDLWLILKGIMMNEGWKIKDDVFRIDSPSTTSNFRELLGINEYHGIINGRGYSLLKVAEREIGRRNLRRFLMKEEEIKFLNFNFIDARIHSSTLDIHPLFEIIKGEFITGIIPILKEIGSFYLISDHGFTDTKELKERYSHGDKSLWETILPFAEIKP